MIFLINIFFGYCIFEVYLYGFLWQLILIFVEKNKKLLLLDKGDIVVFCNLNIYWYNLM